jgi:hypothetical protein
MPGVFRHSPGLLLVDALVTTKDEIRVLSLLVSVDFLILRLYALLDKDQGKHLASDNLALEKARFYSRAFTFSKPQNHLIRIAETLAVIF